MYTHPFYSGVTKVSNDVLTPNTVNNEANVVKSLFKAFQRVKLHAIDNGQDNTPGCVSCMFFPKRHTPSVSENISMILKSIIVYMGKLICSSKPSPHTDFEKLGEIVLEVQDIPIGVETTTETTIITATTKEAYVAYPYTTVHESQLIEETTSIVHTSASETPCTTTRKSLEQVVGDHTKTCIISNGSHASHDVEGTPIMSIDHSMVSEDVLMQSHLETQSNKFQVVSLCVDKLCRRNAFTPDEFDELIKADAVECAVVPYDRPNKRVLGFASIQRTDEATLKLNTFISSTHPMLYFVLFTGGWCVLDDVQATYLQEERLLSIGLDVKILQVHVLPLTDATMCLMQAVLNSVNEPTERDFLSACLQCRCTLATIGLGLEAIILKPSDNIVDASAYDDIGVHASRYMHVVSEFLSYSVDFSFGAQTITVSELYDALIDGNSRSQRDFLNTGCTQHAFRKILRNLSITTTNGFLNNFVWKKSLCPKNYDSSHLERRPFGA